MKKSENVQLPKMASAQNLMNTRDENGAPKSRSSYRTTRMGFQSSIGTTKAAHTRKPLGGSAMRTGAGTLGFSHHDISSAGMNRDKMVKLNNVLELDRKFTLVERGKFKVNPKAY